MRLRELAQMNCLAAEKIKANLDNKFGKNNYKLITIGRSLSSIAELLVNLGVDVKQIPISGLRTSDISSICYSPKDLILYKSFLETIGLTKDNLKKNSKIKYILTDYTYMGRSIEKMFKFLTEPQILDSPENLICMPVKDILGNDDNSKYINFLLGYSRFKYFSQVGKLYPQNIKRVFIQSSPDTAKEYRGNITKGMRKLFWFNVYDSIANGNYNIIVPTKEIEAINKNFLSEKAVRNYIKKQNKKIESITL